MRPLGNQTGRARRNLLGPLRPGFAMPASHALVVTDADVYTRKPAPPPPLAARLLIGYDALAEGIADVRYWLFLASVGPHYEVWQSWSFGLDPVPDALPAEALQAPYPAVPLVGLGDRLGRAITFTAPPWSQDVAEQLAAVLVRCRFPFEQPRAGVHGGLLSAAVWDEALEAFHRELDDHRREALERYEANPSALVGTARDLGLRPEPSQTGPSSWSANCPGTQHWIRIDAETDRWGCGYCKRKGGADELRAFVRDRRGD